MATMPGHKHVHHSKAVSTGTATVGDFSARVLWRRRWFWPVAGGALAAVIIVVGLVLWRHHASQSPDTSNTYSESRQQVAQYQLQQLKADQPSDNAPVADQLTSLAAIVETQYTLGHYKDVVATYQQMVQKAGDRNLQDGTYLLVALAYHQLGDQQSAVQLVDKAESVDKQISNKADRNDALADVANVRARITQ